MSCCKAGKSSLEPPPQGTNEIELWMEMITYMLECADLTMTAIKDAKQKMKFSDNDLKRFSELCNTVGKVKEQLGSVGEDFLKSPNCVGTNKLLDTPKPSMLTKKKVCCMQDDEMIKRPKKKLNFRKNACFCGKFKSKIVNKSKDKQIIVCSPAKQSAFINQKCSHSYVIPKDTGDSGGEPENLSQDTDNDDHPFIIKHTEKCSLPEHGIGYEFFCAMKRYSDRIAQYIDDTGEHQTFGELLRDCISLALKLLDKNLDKDDVICICLSNHKYTCVPYIAAAFTGCQINTLDVTSNLTQLDYFLEKVKPKLMFVQKEMLPLVEASIMKNDIDVDIVVIGGDVEGYVPFGEYLEASEEDISSFRPEKVDEMHETFALLYTSGTTEEPKGVLLSHHCLLKQFLEALSSGNFQKVFLTYSSYYSITTSIFLGTSILGGFSRVVASHFKPEEFYRIIKQYKVESAFIEPYDCITLTRIPKPEDADTSSLQVLATGGACLKATYLQELRNLFPGTCIFQTYVLTETGGLTLSWSKNQSQHITLLNAKPGSSGMPCSGVSCKIVDVESGNILGPNQTGELYVKSDTIMQGYQNQNSSDVVGRSGWFKTGDLAFYDEYHCFYIIDKLTELINVKENLIQPCKLENILMEHPVVERAVVLGLPDSENDVVLVGFVQIKPTEDDNDLYIDFNEIVEYVNKQVTEEESLKGGIRKVESFPLTATGKVRRKFFRESVMKEENTEDIKTEGIIITTENTGEPINEENTEEPIDEEKTEE